MGVVLSMRGSGGRPCCLSLLRCLLVFSLSLVAPIIVDCGSSCFQIRFRIRCKGEGLRAHLALQVDLLLFYMPLGEGHLGESWSKWSLLQAAGCAPPQAPRVLGFGM